jgi:hypothetical protein
MDIGDWIVLAAIAIVGALIESHINKRMDNIERVIYKLYEWQGGAEREEAEIDQLIDQLGQ